VQATFRREKHPVDVPDRKSLTSMNFQAGPFDDHRTLFEAIGLEADTSAKTKAAPAMPMANSQPAASSARRNRSFAVRFTI
jgi:hypothetical protein